MLRANDEPQHWTNSLSVSVAFPGRTEGVRKIAKRFGVNAATVQRISRPFGGASAAA
jgi:transposase-like protein